MANGVPPLMEGGGGGALGVEIFGIWDPHGNADGAPFLNKRGQ